MVEMDVDSVRFIRKCNTLARLDFEKEGEKVKAKLKRWTPFLYILIIIAMLALFFTNDFGLLDIHKTSLIVAVGIDTDGEEVQVTAQVAVPQPSQSGDSINYVEVQGSGLTVADALNEINVKTGTYPRLLFCKLILLGEACQNEELFRMLGCFYRRNYSELTALVAMCKGKAQDMLALPANIAPENSTAIQKVLSEELKKSANVSTANLKSVAETNYSVNGACYMPFVEANVQGTSQNGGNGDNVGGESGGQEGQGGGQQGGSGGEQGGQGGGSGQGESGGQSSGQQGGQSAGQSSKQEGRQMEFTARKTAVFSDGKFAGILDEQQSFALNILKNEIRLAVVPCDADGIHYTVGLKSTSSKEKLKIVDGVPELTLSFSAQAQTQGARIVLEPESVMSDDTVREGILKATEDEIRSRLESLVTTCVETDCDVIGVKGLLHKFNYKYYEAFKDDILSRMKVNYDIKIVSLN